MNKGKKLLEDKDIKFIGYFSAVFFGSFFLLYMLGLLPNEISSSENNALDAVKLNALEMVSEPETPVYKPDPIQKEVGEEPVRLVIPLVDIDFVVQNPKTKDNVLLNEYLTRATVRYPDSALLGAGHVLIFGHSSNWKVVQNKAYKALNGIEKLEVGDPIYVYSKDSRYTYAVTKVSMVNASEEFVDFGTGENMLTLATCNTFGSKEDRYVTEAKFVEKVDL